MQTNDMSGGEDSDDAGNSIAFESTVRLTTVGARHGMFYFRMQLYASQVLKPDTEASIGHGLLLGKPSAIQMAQARARAAALVAAAKVRASEEAQKREGASGESGASGEDESGLVGDNMRPALEAIGAGPDDWTPDYPNGLSGADGDGEGECAINALSAASAIKVGKTADGEETVTTGAENGDEQMKPHPGHHRIGARGSPCRPEEGRGEGICVAPSACDPAKTQADRCDGGGNNVCCEEGSEADSDDSGGGESGGGNAEGGDVGGMRDGEGAAGESGAGDLDDGDLVDDDKPDVPVVLDNTPVPNATLAAAPSAAAALADAGKDVHAEDMENIKTCQTVAINLKAQYVWWMRWIESEIRDTYVCATTKILSTMCKVLYVVLPSILDAQN
jgi:hypothetical protein